MPLRRAGDGQYARNMQPDWTAPAAAGPVRARLRPPGSKSMTNRALVLAALATGPTMITNPLRARDTLLMAVALRSLGAVIDETSGDGGQRGQDERAVGHRLRAGRPQPGAHRSGRGGRRPVRLHAASVLAIPAPGDPRKCEPVGPSRFGEPGCGLLTATICAPAIAGARLGRQTSAAPELVKVRTCVAGMRPRVGA